MARQSRRLVIFLWALAALAFARLGVIAVRSIHTPTAGFVAYYAPARLLIEGADAALFYDDDWFRERVKRFEPTANDIFWANPPTMSMLLLPLSWVRYRVARGLWIVGSMLAVQRRGRALAWGGGTALVFAAFVLLGLVVSPVSTEAHFTLALLPIAILVAELETRWRLAIVWSRWPSPSAITGGRVGSPRPTPLPLAP